MLTSGPRDARIFRNADGLILLVLSGRPHDKSYVESATEMYRVMVVEGECAHFSPSESYHKTRGEYAAVNAGICYGIGHNEVKDLDLGRHEPMVNRLLNNPHVQRVASYMSGRLHQFSCFFPPHHSLIVQHPSASGLLESTRIMKTTLNGCTKRCHT